MGKVADIPGVEALTEVRVEEMATRICARSLQSHSEPRDSSGPCCREKLEELKELIESPFGSCGRWICGCQTGKDGTREKAREESRHRLMLAQSSVREAETDNI